MLSPSLVTELSSQTMFSTVDICPFLAVDMDRERDMS